MIVLRWYRLLSWVGWHLIRPLGLKDHWGFNLGEDFEEWASMKRFVHWDRLIKRLENDCGYERVEALRPIGWTCEHMTMTSANLITAPRGWCGCKLRPIFHDRNTTTASLSH